MRRNHTFFILLAVSLWMSVGALATRGQAQVTGSIEGTVVDPSKAVVSGSKVTLKNINTGAVQETKTTSEGIYRFELLPPGEYSVSINQEGFRTTTAQVAVHVDQVSTLNFQLEIGSTQQIVSVTEAAPLLQTENGNVATTITETQVQDLPNPGNDVYNILFLAPGAIVPRGGSFPSIYGLPTSSNQVTLNGMEDNDPFNNSTNGGASNLLLGLNEVDEATVVTNGYTGEFGTLAGSNSNVVTKSGTNAFHGDVKYYWSGRAVDANDFFNNSKGCPPAGTACAPQGRPFSNANQWGADFGGPILKNKLFFYVDTEGIRIVLPPSASDVLLPTTQFETATLANLSSLGLSASLPFYQQMFNLYNNAAGAANATVVPSTGGQDGGCGTFTLAGFGGATGTPCARFFLASVPSFNPEWILSFRVDYDIRPDDKIFFHYFTDHGVQATSTDPINPIFNEISVQPSWNAQLVETHVFSPQAINNLTIGVEWYNVQFAAANLPAALQAMPFTLTLSDGTLTTLGSGLSGAPSGRGITTFEVGDDFSWQKGRHNFKFGELYTRWDVTDFFGTTRSLSVPDLTAFFNGGFSGSDASLYTQSYPLSSEQPFAMWRGGGYAQDEWKIRPNLSLTAALRVDHPSDPICRDLCFARLSGSFLAGGDTINTPYNQVIETNQEKALPGLQNLEWQPRLGFAWEPFGTSGEHSTVVRGGVGIFYDSFPASIITGFASNPPNLPSFTVGSTGGYISPAQSTGAGASQINSLSVQNQSADQTFQTGFIQGLSAAQLEAASPAFKIPNLTASDPKMLMPQYQKWSLEVQQGLWHNATATLSYDGDHGIHTWLSIGGYNAFSPTGSFAGLPTTPINPLFNQVTYNASEGTSNYNGATLSFQQRFSSAIVSVNYTYSHAIDMGFGTGQTRTIEDAFDLQRSIGPSDFDVRHYLDADYVWTLPLRHWFREHGPRRLVDGWEVSGVFYARSGFPFSVTDSTDTTTLAKTGYAGATLLGNFSGNTIPTGCGSFDTANAGARCLIPAVSGTNNDTCASGGFCRAFNAFGASTKNMLRGPGYFDWDFGLMKHVNVTERVVLSAGAQAYNVLNHVNFNPPGSSVTSLSSFGIIQTALGPGASVYGSGLGADTSPRIVQLKAMVTF